MFKVYNSIWKDCSIDINTYVHKLTFCIMKSAIRLTLSKMFNYSDRTSVTWLLYKVSDLKRNIICFKVLSIFCISKSNNSYSNNASITACKMSKGRD